MKHVVAAAALAFALTVAYAAALQPDWQPQLNDQDQYLGLARGLVERGEFTHARVDESFIPETNRLPGYPLFIVPACVGGCDHWRIALEQALLFAALVFAASALSRRVIPRRATLATYAVALYLPFAFYGALALSDLPAAALFALGVGAYLRATDERSWRWAVAAGALLAWAGLMRAALLPAPLFLAAIAVLRDRRVVPAAAALVVAAAAVVAPYVAYSEGSFGRVGASTSGAVLWIGVFEHRSEADLDGFEKEQVAVARERIAAFDAITDRYARAIAWLALDEDLGTRARAVIGHDPVAWAAGAISRSIELWAGDVPVPAADATSATVSVAIGLFLTILGTLGSLLVVRRGDGWILTAVIGYVWLTAIPFATEGRYSLPAKPFVIVGAVAFLDALLTTRSARAVPARAGS